ncbi:MAG: hypothetical protein MI922_03850, partial [Bacteroidales bacterium]|nr:hypothetical protein [Bacteroidales bacterium]
NINKNKEMEGYPNTGGFPYNKGVRFLYENKVIYRSADKKHIGLDSIKKYSTSPKWKFKSETEIFDKYFQDDSVLYIFSRNKLHKLDYNKGVELKVIDLNGNLSSTPSFENGTFYFITSTKGLNRKIWSIDVNNWKVNWATEFEHFSFLLDVVHKDNNIYLVDNYGLNKVNKKTGERTLIISGYFETTGISIIRNYLFIPQHIDSEDVHVYAAIDLESNEIKYRRFTSEGFPPVTEETMSEEAKEMKADGISGWKEGLGYNRLDGTEVYFVEDPKTGLVIGNGNGFYCFEFIE